jgi:DNA invertase Pin-like site-specific DNA recombinase
MQKAFAYVRVSGKGQVKGDGFPRQEKAIREYAAAHDIRIVKVFREKGVSGELLDRPALSELLEALHSNGTRLVLVEKLDRLARDLMVQETIVGDLRKNDFELISVAEPDLCQNDPTRKLMRQLMGAVAEYEKAMIVIKLRAARQRSKARNGRCEGAKPFGYLAGETDVVGRMQALRSEGLGFDRIAARLNDEGIKPRRGKKWHGYGVNLILSRATRTA